MSEDRLLIMDDERSFASFVGEVGTVCGYAVVETDDPAEFRERVSGWRPTVIVLDLRMPQLDGIQLIRDLAQAKCTGVLLIATGLDDRVSETARALAAESGLNVRGVIHKPIRAAALREVLERYCSHNRNLDAEALAHAIATRQLTAHYQPIVRLNTGQIAGVEALARWRHPIRGPVSPEVFVPLAEANGLIDSLTDRVLAQALADSVVWWKEGISAFIAINLSAKSMADTGLPERLHQHCLAAGVTPDAVTLELTETATMGDAQMMDTLTRLRVKGFRLSIDDFGTGFSSLRQLRRLPFSEIKIDKSFVMTLAESADNAKIVRSTIDMARDLGLNTIAEGVETVESLELLRQWGCEFAQGFYFSRPMASDALLAQHRMWRGPTDRLPMARALRPPTAVAAAARLQPGSAYRMEPRLPSKQRPGGRQCRA